MKSLNILNHSFCKIQIMILKEKLNVLWKVNCVSMYSSMFTFGICTFAKMKSFFASHTYCSFFVALNSPLRWFAYINHWIYKHRRSCEKDDPQTFNNPFRLRFYIHEFVALVNEHKKYVIMYSFDVLFFTDGLNKWS